MNMKKIYFIILMALLFLSVKAQNNSTSVSTSQIGGRWEIIQSNIARRYFFKLDKYTGDVYQYVKRQDGKNKWQQLSVIGNALGYLNEEITYQLFMGGIAVSDCLLLNIKTGETYKLYEDSDTKELFFARTEL